MTTFACLAAFVGASACWGVLGYVLGLRRGKISERNRIAAITHVSIDPGYISETFTISGGKVVVGRDAALDAEIEGSK